MHKTEDQELIELLSNDPDRGMVEIFKAYYQTVATRVYHYLYDKQATEDLVQEIFLHLWQKREDIVIQSSLRAYLNRVALNRSLNYIRDNKRYRFGEEDDMIGMEADLPDAHDRLRLQELNAVLTAGIESLPPKCRLVFKLSRFEDMSYKEIAEKLDISVKTVENQILKALKVLRAALKEFETAENRGKS